jgi:hypothetical protein
VNQSPNAKDSSRRTVPALRPGTLRRRVSAATLTVCALVLSFAPGAQAEKFSYDRIPQAAESEGSLGEQFGATPPSDGNPSFPEGIGGVAVNSTGAGSGVEAGDIYVVDGPNQRIQQFRANADGEGHRFVRAFGLDVNGGAGDPNVCTVAASCQAGTASVIAGAMNDPKPVNMNVQPMGLAVDQANGNVYLTDLGNTRIDVFSSEGAFEGAFGWNVIPGGTIAFEFCTITSGCQAGERGPAAGQFSNDATSEHKIGPPAIAPDVAPHLAPDAGNVLIPNTDNDRIDEFSVTLNGSKEVTGVAFVRGIGWRVNAEMPEEKLQTCTTATGCQAALAGGNLGQFSERALSRATVDASGAIYAINYPINRCRTLRGEICRVQKFNAAATSAEEFAPAQLSFASNQSRTSTAVTEIAVDPASGDVYVPRPKVSPPEYSILGFDSSGTLLESSKTGIQPGFSGVPIQGIALDTTSGRVYISSTSNEPPHIPIFSGPPAGPPLASTEGSSAGANFALRKLEGAVTPDNFKVGACYFEYGPTAAYGNRAPCTTPPAKLGEGATPVAVSAETELLAPEATYHYRLAAENGLKATGEDGSFTTGPIPADPCPNAAVRAEQGTQTLVLPDCMALEMASPPVKFNHDAYGAQISADGNRVLFTSIADLAGAPGSLGLVGDVYVATRTASGWKTSPTEPPSPLIRGWYNTAVPKSFSPDFSAWYQLASSELQNELGIGQVFSAGIDRGFDPLSSLMKPLNGGDFEAIEYGELEGASADRSHLYFKVGHPQTTYLSGDPVPSAHGAELGAEPNDYVATLDSGGEPTLELLARDSSGEAWGGNCGARVGGTVPQGGNKSNFGPIRNQGAISPDGARVYFSTRPGQPLLPLNGNCDLAAHKLRIMKRTETESGPQIGELVANECVRVSPPCDTTDGNDFYQGASADGTKVYFTTNRQLADSDLDTGSECAKTAGASAGCDLYLYDSSEPVGHRLIQVSAGGAGDATPGEGARVLNGIPAISGDGSHVYFVATGVLTTDPDPSGATAQAGKPNLYLYQRDGAHPAGATAFIGTLSSADSLWGGSGSWQRGGYPVPVNGDGRIYAFATKASLSANDTDEGHLDVYRYDAAATPPSLQCVSCLPGADNGAYDAAVPQLAPEAALRTAGTDFAEVDRWVSEDGDSIAFTTEAPLAPGDDNERVDSYLWRNGSYLRLPGTTAKQGRTPEEPRLSHDGSSVAFESFQRLLPSDGDNALDAYVARVEGGFPTPVPPVPCQAEGCQEPFGARPGDQGAASEAPTPGNVSEPPACKKGFARKQGKCVKRHAKKHRRHVKRANHKRGSQK